MLKWLRRRASGAEEAVRLTERATAEWRADLIVVVSWQVNGDGIWIVGPFVTTLPAAAGEGALGAAVEQALKHSGRTTRSATERGLLDPVLKAAGVRSWTAYVRGLRSVAIERETDDMTVTPYENRGARDGLKKLEALAESVDPADSAELGRAVMRALTQTR